jgi:DNA-binding CsgD family transcriptional regulator
MLASVVPSAREQEYLLRIIEAAHQVRDPAQLFLLAQGQMQALLPHQIMVCLQFDSGGALVRDEVLAASVIDPALRRRLCDGRDGLAVQLAHGTFVPDEDALVASTGPLAGGATAFVLFGLGQRASARQAYFFELVLPHLHLALLRLSNALAPTHAGSRPLSAREAEILRWLRAGKSNHDIGVILGLSPLTIRNHLQRMYRVLGVSNRTQAAGFVMAA